MKNKKTTILISTLTLCLIGTITMVSAAYVLTGRPLGETTWAAPSAMNTQGHMTGREYAALLPQFYRVDIAGMEKYPYDNPCGMIPAGGNWWSTTYVIDDTGLQMLGYDEETHYLLYYTERGTGNTNGRIAAWWERGTDRPAGARWDIFFDLFCEGGDDTLEFDPDQIPLGTAHASIESLPITDIDTGLGMGLAFISMISFILAVSLATLYRARHGKK